MLHFKKAICDLITIYNDHPLYQEKKLSVSRALEHYVKRMEIIELINSKDLENIKNSYKKYLKENKIPCDTEYVNSDDEIKKNIPEYSDNSDSDSSEEYIHIEKKINSNDHDDDDDDNNGKSLLNINNRISNEKNKSKINNGKDKKYKHSKKKAILIMTI